MERRAESAAHSPRFALCWKAAVDTGERSAPGAKSRVRLAISVDASGVVTVTGWTVSTNFPMTSGAYDTTWPYWILGSVTGTRPGVNLLGVHIPLNPDPYTDVAMAAVNTTVFTRFKGTLDANGLATASFNIPAKLPLPPGFTFHHAYVVYDSQGRFYMANNAVPFTLR